MTPDEKKNIFESIPAYGPALSRNGIMVFGNNINYFDFAAVYNTGLFRHTPGQSVPFRFYHVH
jgi:hypothetical protein